MIVSSRKIPIKNYNEEELVWLEQESARLLFDGIITWAIKKLVTIFQFPSLPLKAISKPLNFVSEDWFMEI